MFNILNGKFTESDPLELFFSIIGIFYLFSINENDEIIKNLLKFIL